MVIMQSQQKYQDAVEVTYFGRIDLNHTALQLDGQLLEV